MPRNGNRILSALAGAVDNVTVRAKAVATINFFIFLTFYALTSWQVLSIKA